MMISRGRCNIWVFSMNTVTLEEVQAHLPEILDQLQPGGEITVTAGGKPVALVKKANRTSWPSESGTAKPRTLWMASDFDAPLEDFKE